MTSDGPFEAWARLDPTGVLPPVVRRLRRLPGVGLLERGAGVAERRMLAVLNDRIHDVAELAPPPRSASPAPARAGGAGAPAADEDPAAILERLLRTSVELSARESTHKQLIDTLKKLSPDEARILAALAEGGAYALLHVGVRSFGSTPDRTLLENASTVGRRAGVAIAGRVPVYVTHLRALGLAETDAEDRALETDYAILETTDEVEAAKQQAARMSRLGPRLVRETLRISPFGRELWDVAKPADG